MAAIGILIGAPSEATAIPAFAKKYDVSCALCHQNWPALNRYGESFKINGYQMPETKDGGLAGKRALRSGLFLDSGDASPPISLVGSGSIFMIRAKENPAGERQADDFLCCADENRVALIAAGTIAPDVGYHLDLTFSDDMESAFSSGESNGHMRLLNFFKHGIISADIGSMRVIDYDAENFSQRYFGSARAVNFGAAFADRSARFGLIDSNFTDTGVRIYGHPHKKRFTYEFGFFTGAGRARSERDEDGYPGEMEESKRSFTFMGKIDFTDRFSVSARRWRATPARDFILKVDGEKRRFSPKTVGDTDRVTQYIVRANYAFDHFLFDFSYETAKIETDRKFATINSDEIEYRAEPFNINAFSIGAIWIPMNWFSAGLSYSESTVKERRFTLGGADRAYEKERSALYTIRLETAPALNARLGVEYQFDRSDEATRALDNGELIARQNRALVYWDLSF